MKDKKIEQTLKKVFGEAQSKIFTKEKSEIVEQSFQGFENLAQFIDHTLLKPDAQEKEIVQLCAEAEKYKFASVCVNPLWAKIAKDNLPNIPLCCVVGFPLGASSSSIKLSEAKEVLEAGAKEVDMVINIGALKGKSYQKVEQEIHLLSEVCHKYNAKLKVIIEICLLTEEEKIVACWLSKKAEADFVKTSTGFSIGGATESDVALMRKVVGNKMGVKASGGIRDRATALKLLQAGANRIGASAGIKICKK